MVDQALVNWLFVSIGAALGWIMKNIWDAIQDLKSDIKQIERDLSHSYVRKDDFQTAVYDFKEDTKEIRHNVKESLSKVHSPFKGVTK